MSKYYKTYLCRLQPRCCEGHFLEPAYTLQVLCLDVVSHAPCLWWADVMFEAKYFPELSMNMHPLKWMDSKNHIKSFRYYCNKKGNI